VKQPPLGIFRFLYFWGTTVLANVDYIAGGDRIGLVFGLAGGIGEKPLLFPP
jgi:hypothetical protein